MTVADLIAYLSQFDPDTKVVNNAEDASGLAPEDEYIFLDLIIQDWPDGG